MPQITIGPGAKKAQASTEASADSIKAGVLQSSTGGASPIRLSKIDELEAMAKLLRRHIVNMVGQAGSGHPGGSLSAADIVTSLFFRVMHYDPTNPRWPDRDRFILSKGHAAPVLYAALAEAGFISTKELTTLRQLDSRLQGHPDMTLTPGVEASTGSLGQGLSFANGVALAGLLDNRRYRVYALLGDGECDEGQVWEAAMAAAHYKLDNLVAIIDRNGLQIDGSTKDIMRLEPMADKWSAFGWHTIEIDGHDFTQILAALDEAAEVKTQPTVLIARTVKGKGVSFMENVVDFHGKAPSPDQLQKALEDLA